MNAAGRATGRGAALAGRLACTRRAVTAALCAFALAGGVLATAAASPGGSPLLTGPEPSSRITPELAAAFDRDGATDFWIRFSAGADTSRARAQGDRTARGQQVVDALRSTADDSQAQVRALLDREGVTYRSFWVTNAIRVHGGTAELAATVAALDGVEEIRTPQVYAPPDPVIQPASMAPSAVEWGVANINADDVWAQYATRGENIVVASIDTGVQYDHPALVRQYRGNNGDGTFDHNYNWFDAQGRCDGAPCDGDGHGTHTTGTIVGDDGNGNQIGVAPAVTWIAANGCCPNDEALLRSSEWMLAPTDLNGQNPDVSKRPHIINNSWSTTVPTNDPFFEDIQQAWADSGIFGVWANGNNGPECNTSGSPGSRILNYSVGAYDSTNTVASFSSRGPGQDGEIKPNISAPGVDVRSSWPNGTYAIGRGTSMAAPHVTGAVALLWAARPAMVRDVAGTRAALDLSAVDTPDEQCGGTPEDNGVYGEGRLDALRLVEVGTGGFGVVTGTVTAADTGEPVTNATVTATGPIERRDRTGADGTYSIVLAPGEYQVEVAGVFGYDRHTDTVQVGDGSTTHDVALTPTPKVAITGTVTDGSAHGWPLYARLVASDGTGHEFTTFTNPVTGRYSLPVVPNTTYMLSSTAAVPGYQPARQQVGVAAGPTTVDTALPVALSCTAPGYRAMLTGSTQTFDSQRAPRGWTVSNRDPHYPGYDHQPGWVFTDPGGRTNTTGGSGRFAIVDSDHSGQNHVQDTFLTSPALDMSGTDSPALLFATDLEPAVNGTAAIDLSTDDGQSWTTVWHDAGHPGIDGPHTQTVLLPDAAHQSDVRVRFHYTGQWSGWWQIDDVFLGNRDCVATEGGLVVGQVTDAATDAGMTGATVTSGSTSTTTVATPDDPAIGDGYYWLPAPAGSQSVTASHPGHTARTEEVSITDDAVTRLDLPLSPAA